MAGKDMAKKNERKMGGKVATNSYLDPRAPKSQRTTDYVLGAESSQGAAQPQSELRTPWLLLDDRN
jgi:hypothetical protein